MNIDAMKQALKALEWALGFIPPESETNCECPLCEAHDVLRLAIEQAERGAVVGTRTSFEDGKIVVQPLYHDDVYAAPPQRQPLTVKEVYDLIEDCTGDGGHVHYYTLVRAIEAAHGIGGDHD